MYYIYFYTDITNEVFFIGKKIDEGNNIPVSFDTFYSLDHIHYLEDGSFFIFPSDEHDDEHDVKIPFTEYRAYIKQYSSKVEFEAAYDRFVNHCKPAHNLNVKDSLHVNTLPNSDLLNWKILNDPNIDASIPVKELIKKLDSTRLDTFIYKDNLKVLDESHLAYLLLSSSIQIKFVSGRLVFLVSELWFNDYQRKQERLTVWTEYASHWFDEDHRIVAYKTGTQPKRCFYILFKQKI